MQVLQAAAIHEVKNQLAELALRLEMRGDCARETAIVMASAQQLTALLLSFRAQTGDLRINVDAAYPGELVQQLAEEYRTFYRPWKFGPMPTMRRILPFSTMISFEWRCQMRCTMPVAMPGRLSN